MAITTDSAIEFFGTQDTVTSSSSSVADGAFSVSGDVSTWTNDDDALSASVVLSATYSSAPDANSTVALYARLMDIQSTNDQDEPTANYPHSLLGVFPLKNVTSLQHTAIEVSLPNTKASQTYDFYIENNGGQTLSAGWELYVTPKAVGPHA